jgi:hypothetical protein
MTPPKREKVGEKLISGAAVRTRKGVIIRTASATDGMAVADKNRAIDRRGRVS